MGREAAQAGPAMDGDLLKIVIIDPHQPGIVPHPDFSTQILRRYGVVGSGHLDVAVTMDPAAAFVEHGEGIGWQSLQRRPLHLLEDLAHLALGSAVDTGIRYRGLPAQEEAIELGETPEDPALDGVILHILYPAFDLALLPG